MIAQNIRMDSKLTRQQAESLQSLLFTSDEAICMTMAVARAMNTPELSPLVRDDMGTAFSKLLGAMNDELREITLEQLKSVGVNVTVEFVNKK